MDSKEPRTVLSSIGWGVTNPKLDQDVKRRALAGADMPHKKAFDFGGLRDIIQMETTGFTSTGIDAWLGIPYEVLDDLSVREQRVIVKRRVAEIRQQEALRRMTSRSPTKPIDTETNTRLYLKQMDKKNTQWNLTLNSVGSRDKQNPEVVANSKTRRSRSKPIEQYLTASVKSAGGSDLGNESTTAGLASEDLGSPLISQKRQGGLSLNTSHHLKSVAEYPISATHQDYRKKRLLSKGCPKLLRMVKQQETELDKQFLST